MYGTTAARTPDQTTIRYTHPIARHTPHAPSIRSCSQFSVFPDDGNSHLIIHTAASLIPALQGSSMRSWHWRAIFNEMFMDCLLAMVFRKFGSPEKDIYDDAVLLGVPFGFGGHLSAVHLPMHWDESGRTSNSSRLIRLTGERQVHFIAFVSLPMGWDSTNSKNCLGILIIHCCSQYWSMLNTSLWHGIIDGRWAGRILCSGAWVFFSFF